MYKWKFNIELNYLELMNFRGIEAMRLQFDPKLTVLIGENGSGKTSVLDALASLLQVFVNKTTSQNTTEIRLDYISNDDIRNGTIGATNTISIYFEHDKYLEEDRLWEEVSNSGSLEKYEEYLEKFPHNKEKAEAYRKETNDWHYALEIDTDTAYKEYIEKYPKGRYTNDANFFLKEEDDNTIEELPIDTNKETKTDNILSLEWYSELGRTNYEVDEIETTDFNKLNEVIKDLKNNYEENLNEKDKGKHMPINVPLVVYYPCSTATTNITTTNDKLRTDIMSAYDDALTYNSFDFTKFFRWFKWQENIKTQLGENILLDVVADAIYQMLNDKEALFSNLRTDWINDPDGELLIDKGDSENPLKINQFSSGEKHILSLTADLARRLTIANPYAEYPLHGNGIVLIDEIDLHLHPRWQRSILPKLMEIFPNIQWVVTTHSALVLQTIEQDKASVLIIENGQIVDREVNHFGRDIDDMLLDIYGLGEKRPMIQPDLDQLFELIDNEQYEAAKAKIKELAAKGLTQNDSELVHANTLIDFMEDEELMLED